MSAVGVRSILPLALVGLASCVNPLHSGRDSYADGMRRLRYDPASAESSFADADRELAEALAENDLDPGEHVLAVTLRARCLIELERHGDVPAVINAEIPGYQADKGWRGDAVGLALLRASRLDPERGYAELVLAEKKASTLRSRVHLAWAQVHLLQKLGTPQAKAEAVRICEANQGKLDFDALKQSLSTP
jgi:hypothetical protein